MAIYTPSTPVVANMPSHEKSTSGPGPSHPYEPRKQHPSRNPELRLGRPRVASSEYLEQNAPRMDLSKLKHGVRKRRPLAEPNRPPSSRESDEMQKGTVAYDEENASVPACPVNSPKTSPSIPDVCHVSGTQEVDSSPIPEILPTIQAPVPDDMALQIYTAESFCPDDVMEEQSEENSTTLCVSGTYETRSSSQILGASPASPEPGNSLPFRGTYETRSSSQISWASPASPEPGNSLPFSGTYETRSSSQILRASPATPEPASSLPSQIILDPFQATPLANVTPQEAPVLLTQEDHPPLASDPYEMEFDQEIPLGKSFGQGSLGYSVPLTASHPSDVIDQVKELLQEHRAGSVGASPATPEPASSLPSQIILDPFQATPLANVTPQEAPVLLTQEDHPPLASDPYGMEFDQEIPLGKSFGQGSLGYSVPLTASHPSDVLDQVKELLQEHRAGSAQFAQSQPSHADLSTLIREAVRAEMTTSQRISSGSGRSDDIDPSHGEFPLPSAVDTINETEQVSPKNLEKIVRDAVRAEMHARKQDHDDASDGDSEGDDDDDGELKRKVKLPMTKEEKCFHTMLRSYLENINLRGENVKDPPPAEEVKAFEEDNALSMPMLNNPRIDWIHNFSSSWNKEAVFVLATDFRQSKLLQVTHIQFPPSLVEVHNIQSKIVFKLRRPRQRYLDKLPPAMEDKETALQKENRISEKKIRRRKMDRRCGRRHTMHKKRGEVIKKHFPENPKYWGGVLDVHKSLGPDGMSSDETETDDKGRAVKPKRLRRVEKPWVNTEITAIWEHVDALSIPVEPTSGNKSLPRIHEARSTNTSATPVFGLPGNYYNSLWCLGRHPNERAALHRKKDRPIPSTSSLLTDDRDNMQTP